GRLGRGRAQARGLRRKRASAPALCEFPLRGQPYSKIDPEGRKRKIAQYRALLNDGLLVTRRAFRYEKKPWPERAGVFCVGIHEGAARCRMSWWSVPSGAMKAKAKSSTG